MPTVSSLSKGLSGVLNQLTFVKNESVVRREIAGETILVPIKGTLASLQQIFVLNPVAAFIWERLDGRTELGAIFAGIVERFEVAPEEARADLEEFLAALEKAGLITAASMASAPDPQP